MKKNKFYNFVTTKTSNDLYLYGAIVSGEKWDETEVDFKDFKNKIDELEDNSTLNIYQNSPGGDCFACSSMIALLQRAKDRRITINAYIDGLSASCSSWISCMADNLYIYGQSMMMLHKPMSMAFGNADEMRKEIEVLDKMQNEVMLPIYMKKVKDGVTEEQIQELVNAETWLSADEIQEYFDCILLDGVKQVACSVDKNLFNRYNNVPKELLDLANKEVDNVKNEVQDEEVVEVSDDEVSDDEASSKVQELEDELKGTKETIGELNNKINELNTLIDTFTQREKDNKINEKRNYFKNRFEKANALDKFESKEVQNLINTCLDDINSMSKINEILISAYDNLEFNKDSHIVEEVSNLNNLLDIVDDVSKYGFR